MVTTFFKASSWIVGALVIGALLCCFADTPPLEPETDNVFFALGHNPTGSLR